MPIERPTLQQLRDRAKGDALSRLQGLDPVLRRSLLQILLTTHAGGMHGLYAFAKSFIVARILPTAEGDALSGWASIWDLSRTDAAFASGSVTFTGTNGTLVPSGTALQAGDGTEYVTTEDATIGTSPSADVAAVESGEDGNQAAGAILSLVSPVSGVDPTATVDSGGLTGGADEESDADLLARLLDRIQEAPQGGNANDWESWAKAAIPGITRVWVTPPPDGSAVVSILFVLDGQSPITATAQQIADVLAYLELPSIKPLGAVPSVGTPTLVSLNLTISNLQPDTTEVRAAIEAELANLILEDAAPGGTILISRLREAISRAFGEEDHVLTSPAANVTHAAGELAVLGTVTYA